MPYFLFSSFLIIVEYSIMDQMSWKRMNKVFPVQFILSNMKRKVVLLLPTVRSS